MKELDFKNTSIIQKFSTYFFRLCCQADRESSKPQLSIELRNDPSEKVWNFCNLVFAIRCLGVWFCYEGGFDGTAE